MVPEVAVLRDKDRVLWAKSFEKQLNKDIAMLFQKEEPALTPGPSPKGRGEDEG